MRISSIRFGHTVINLLTKIVAELQFTDADDFENGPGERRQRP